MMQQYFEIKNQHEDYVLLYRLGDFYEMFFDDAERISKELDLTLTGRDCGQAERAPMCGVPYHSADSYIARLIAKGYKVAICEQTEDPATAKGLVRREVVRMITPGTIIEHTMLDEGRNNFIAGVYLDSRGAGLCFCDISTGEFHATELRGEDILGQLIAEIGRFAPRELVLSDGAYSLDALTAFARDKLECYIERGGEWRFIPESAQEAVSRQFGISDFAQSGLEDAPLLLQAAGGLLSYLHETQKQNLSHIRELSRYSQDAYMALDYTARRNLEITASLQSGDKKGSLLWVLDHTKTPMGARLLRQWLEKPLISVPRIRERQSAVAAMVAALPQREALERALSPLGDMERIMGRIVYGSANARDLLALSAVCAALPAIKEALSALDARYLRQLEGQMDLLADIGTRIGAALDPDDPPHTVREGGMIRLGFDPEVDRLRALLKGGTGRLADIEQRERARTGIPKLKVGYNRVFGYYLEAGRAHSHLIPEDYIRKQTLANAERYITQELKELEGEVLSAGDRLNALEYQLFTGLREQIALESHRVQRTAQAVAVADVLMGLAKAAARYGYICPEVDDSGAIDIREGRHPVVERVLEGSAFVPNDTTMDVQDNRVYIITGPNMAGKSTFMRQVALITLMAQCGSFVPAGSARIGVVDRIFTRVGASDDLFAGRSTFMVEMNEVADILRHATARSLLILDEIGRGTSTFDGMSIARAVLEHAADKRKLGAKTLFATHYHELCEMEGQIDGVKNYNVVVKKRGDDIIFIKKIVRGGTGDSFGIEVAKLAGVPDSVIRRAKEVLRDIESRTPGTLSALALPTAEDVPDDQLSLGTFAQGELMEQLRRLEPDTFTPIEALSLLYELSRKAKEM